MIESPSKSQIEYITAETQRRREFTINYMKINFIMGIPKKDFSERAHDSNTDTKIKNSQNLS
jgi:hypothetical protein